MQRPTSPPFASLLLLGLLWIAWLVVAPRAGYLLGGIAFFLAILYVVHPSTRAALHHLMAWPLQPARPQWPLATAILGALSFAWPLYSPSSPSQHSIPRHQLAQRPHLPSPTNSQTPSPRTSSAYPASSAEATSARAPSKRHLPQPSNTLSLPTPPTSSSDSSAPSPIPTTTDRPRPVIQAIQKTLEQLARFRTQGAQQQQLRERIAQGDPLAKDECLRIWKALQPELNAYNKRLDRLPDEIGMHARPAGQLLETCLGCGLPIDGKTYCGQIDAFERDATQAFKKLY
ncbi:hypothetical protein L6R29_14155 [Myxococcota bacterium]|nr:hypothetical protein [Myxococcota bacterium]